MALVSCGADPGDIAAFERSEITSTIAVGSAFNSAEASLFKRGFECQLSSGEYATESGDLVSAPSFLDCSKTLRTNLVCKFRMQVVVVPQHSTVGSVHIRQRDACL